MPYVEVWVDDPEPTKEQAEAIDDLVCLAREAAVRLNDRVLERAANRVAGLMPHGYVDAPSPRLPVDQAYKRWRDDRDAKPKRRVHPFEDIESYVAAFAEVAFIQ